MLEVREGVRVERMAKENLENREAQLGIHIADVHAGSDRPPSLPQVFDGSFQLGNVLLPVLDNFELLRGQPHLVCVRYG